MAARGLIIVIPLLIAAGVAVYESPQVRQFIDEHRRKLALALNDLGDQSGSASGSQADSQRPAAAAARRRSSRDAAAAREDQSPEAEARRRNYRQELAERRRMAEERRGGRPSLNRQGSSFDDLVDADGNLRGVASGLENGAMEMGTLRRRHNETAGAALGAAFANPFADEMHMDGGDRGLAMSDEDLARQLQAQYDAEYAGSQRSSKPDDAPLTQREIQELERIVREEAERQGRELPEPGSNFRMSEEELLHNLEQFQVELTESEAASHGRRTPVTTATPSTRTVPRTPPSEAASLDAEGVLVEAAPSTHPSEALVDLTPTTSAPGTPRQMARQPWHQPSYHSIQDWAEQSTAAASFHSLYDASEAAPRSTRSEVSELSSDVEVTSEHEVSDLDFVSERGISTPGTWTEVGSVVSGDDHHEQQQQQQQHH